MYIVVDTGTNEKAVVFTADEWAGTMAAFEILVRGYSTAEGTVVRDFAQSMLDKSNRMLG